MSANTIFFTELLLGHGVVLAWAFWELRSLRRDKQRARDSALAERAGHAEGQDGANPG